MIFEHNIDPQAYTGVPFDLMGLRERPWLHVPVSIYIQYVTKR
jgi:hypothetical protein